MIAAFTNHLWQSTLFVLAAGLVAAALRKNGAHVRHRVWLIASLKFLVPFSVLMSLGSALPSGRPAATPIASPAAPDLSIAVDRLAQPFTGDVFFSSAPVATTQTTTNWTAIGLIGVWMAGFVAIAFLRFRDWRRIRAAVRASRPLTLVSESVCADLKVRATSHLLEPGVVGLWRPVLLVPAGIEHHLTPPQLEAVLAHELCHVQRRDNLTSAIHMVVEAAFWFHPLVWFVGARLVEERERACDEHVLRVCGEPRMYAESILNVCKLYVESPIACVSGVSGADLKKRIAAIIGNRIGLQLNPARKVGLVLAAVLAVALPLVAGMITAPLSASARLAEARGAKADAFAAAQDAAASARQATPGPSPKFDVVSIKPCPGLDVVRPPGSGRGANPRAPQITPGYVHWDCVPLAELIDQAWGGLGNGPRGNQLLNTVDRVRPDSPKRVRGGPSWVHDDVFTIEAKMSGDASELTGAARFVQIRDAMVPALRAMLEDRFALKLRKATEQQSMYAMTVAKGGLKITQTAPAKCWQAPLGLGRGVVATPPPGFEGTPACGINFHGMMDRGVRQWEVTHGSLKDFAGWLSSQMDRYVLDQTGVEGRFSFKFEYLPDDSTPGSRLEPDRDPGFDIIGGVRVPSPPPPPPRTDAPAIFKALELLGLKLEPTKGPSEYLLIDSVQKPRPDSPAEMLEPPARAQGAGQNRRPR